MSSCHDEAADTAAPPIGGRSRAGPERSALSPDGGNRTPYAVVMVNTKGRIEFVNAEAEIAFGYRRAELLGQFVEMLVPDRFRAAHPELRNAFLAKAQSRPMGKGRILFARRKDGSEFQVEIALNPITSDDSLVVLSSIIDMSDRRQKIIEAAYLAAIVDSSSDAIIGKNLEGIVTSWNAAAEAMFGYTAAEMIGQPITTIIPPARQDEETMILRRIRTGDRIENFETIRRRKDGGEIAISLTVSPIRGPGGEIVGASKSPATSPNASASSTICATARNGSGRYFVRSARVSSLSTPQRIASSM